MCTYSVVMDHWRPWIPEPHPWRPAPGKVQPWPKEWPNQPPDDTRWPWGEVPSSPPAQPSSTEPHVPEPDELRRLIDSLHAALAAAEALDEAAGHPDCGDPEKAKLLERVEILEQRLWLIELGQQLAQQPQTVTVSGTSASSGASLPYGNFIGGVTS